MNSPLSKPDPATGGPSGRRVVVSDAGPLISLGRLDLLALLPALFAEVQVPEPVLNECAARPGNEDTQRISHAIAVGWLTPCDPESIPEGPLGRGERAAIARALFLDALLLTDDHVARLHAQSVGLTVIGTLGVLIRAKRSDLITQVGPLIERLRTSGQRFGHEVVRQALAAAGEEPT